jgi:hypothetical protein
MEHMKKWFPVAWVLGLMCVAFSGCRKSEAPASSIGVPLPSLTVATQMVMPVVEQVLTNLTSAMIDNTNAAPPSSKYLGSGLLAEEVRRIKNNITQNGLIRKDVHISNIEISSLDSESSCLLARVTGYVITEKGTNATRWNLLIEMRGTNAIPRIVGMSEMNETPAAKATVP